MSDHLDPTNSRSVAKLLLETIILSTSMEKIRINLTDCRNMNQDPTRTPPSVFESWKSHALESIVNPGSCSVDPQTNQALEKELFSMITGEVARMWKCVKYHKSSYEIVIL